jgi:site-specific DNA-methyltransferase (adenine-specific)
MRPDLRLGRWQEALRDVEMVDAIVTDPPYSSRTHGAYCADGADGADGANRQVIGYGSWSIVEVHEFVAAWSERCRGWIAALTDTELYPAWRDAFRAYGRYVFAPLPLVSPGSAVRLSGDGPSSWTCWLVVARPSTKAFTKWGTLPGAYICPPGEKVVMGGKPLVGMRSIIRDYSRPGDLVCDPCAGGGTTLLAAAIEGRRSVGAEMDESTFRKAQARLRRGYTPSLFPGAT